MGGERKKYVCCLLLLLTAAAAAAAAALKVKVLHDELNNLPVLSSLYSEFSLLHFTLNISLPFLCKRIFINSIANELITKKIINPPS